MGAAIVGLLDPQWAAPANTALLIILAYVTGKLRTKVNVVHQDVNSAAAAALAAAEAAAHAATTSLDAARITKEIGGAVRRTELK